jgi:hypothetical protein
MGMPWAHQLETPLEMPWAHQLELQKKVAMGAEEREGGRGRRTGKVT